MTLIARRTIAALAVLATLATGVEAAPTAAAKCAASKIKGAGKSLLLRTKCEAKALKKGEPVDASCVTSANQKLADAFSDAEAGGACEPSTGQAGDAQTAVDACIGSFVAAVSGDAPCAAGKMKAVGKTASGQLKCWQKGYLAGGDADAECVSTAALKLDPAVAKADSRGACTGTTAALSSLVEDCVQSLLAPGATTTTVPDTTTSTIPDTTTTTVAETTTTTAHATTTTTTTTVDIGPVGWTFCAHAGQTCTLPRHDLPISFQGVPPNSPYVTTIDDLSVECSPAALFPGVDAIAGQTGDCYYLNAGCDYESTPFGVAVLTDQYYEVASLLELHSPPHGDEECFDGTGTNCRLQPNAHSADTQLRLSVFVVDPRVCDSDDRARLSYHWRIFYPPNSGQGTTPFTPRGITGYLTSELTFIEQTMPSTDALTDKDWRAEVAIVQELHPDFPLSSSEVEVTQRTWFRYMDSGITINQAAVCQMFSAPDPSCEFDQLLLPDAGTY